jgi:hypothetical protein
VETAQPELSPMLAATSAMGRMETSMSEVSTENVAIGQVFVPVGPPLLPLDGLFRRRRCHRRGRRRLVSV